VKYPGDTICKTHSLMTGASVHNGSHSNPAKIARLHAGGIKMAVPLMEDTAPEITQSTASIAEVGGHKNRSHRVGGIHLKEVSRKRSRSDSLGPELQGPGAWLSSPNGAKTNNQPRPTRSIQRKECRTSPFFKPHHFFQRINLYPER
jgi:hypothetical protein